MCKMEMITRILLGLVLMCFANALSDEVVERYDLLQQNIQYPKSGDKNILYNIIKIRKQNREATLVPQLTVQPSL